ncbi:MAG: Crp/Fnr family transcriptional regulator [Gammaproteobacteria bacterium]|nr:Crp/Fnr family transcriptional regulator [Gammaproteobacteria bacterium]
MGKKKAWHEASVPLQCEECPVRKLALFQPLNKTEVKAAHKFRSEVSMLEQGKVIFRQGEICNEAFTLYDGWACLYQDLADGRRQILKFLLPGDFFGFQTDFGTGVRAHSARTLTGASMCVFSGGGFLKLFKKKPALGIRLTWMTAQDQAVAHEHLASLGRRSAKERIAYLMMEIFHRVRERQGEQNKDNKVSIPLTQDHIADATGLTPIHVNRTLKSLRQAKLVELQGNELQVPDPDALADIAGFNWDIFSKPSVI